MEEKRKLVEAYNEEELARAEWAALVLQKNWRAYKTRKEMNRTLGTSHGASRGSSMRFVDE